MIHLIKNKDYTGLEQLIDSYGSSILMTIHRILQAPPEQSEWSDVANEVFYEIWQKIEAYDPEKSSFITWILLITRSRGIDRKRKLNKAFQQESIEEYQELAITESPLSEEEFLIWARRVIPSRSTNFSFILFLSRKSRRDRATTGFADNSYL